MRAGGGQLLAPQLPRTSKILLAVGLHLVRVIKGGEEAPRQQRECLQQVAEAIVQAKVRLNANVNFETTMELVLLRMKA